MDAEKPTRQVNFKLTDHQYRALYSIARLQGVSAGSLVRQFIDAEWSKHAEDLKKIEETITKARKRARAA